MMKKTVLFTIVFTLFCSALLSNPIAKIDNWAAEQTENFDANDVVTFLNGNRDGDITFGSEYEFNSAFTYYISATTLDATHFVAAYQDFDNSEYGTAIVGNVSGTNITYGSEYIFNLGSTCDISVTTLDETQFVVAYCDLDNSGYGTAIVGAVSGSFISFGYEYVFNDAYTSYISATVLDATHIVVTYNDYGNSEYGTAIVGTVSNFNITYGSEYVFNSGYSYHISATTLDATHFVVAYQDESNSKYGTARAGTVSGSTIFFGSEYVFNSAWSYNCSATSLDATHFVVAYQDYGNSSYGTAIVGTVSGSAISYGSEYVFNAAITNHCSATTLDETHFVVAYQDYGNSSYGTAVVGNVSGSDISYGSEYVFNSANTWYNSATTLDATHFVVAYQDRGNSSHGTAIVGGIENEVTVTVTGTSIAPSGTSPGATEVGMLKLSFITDIGIATWAYVKVDLTGTAIDADISSVEIWKDDGNGTWDGSGSKADTQIGFGTFSSNTVTIDIMDQYISTISQDFFVVYDIAVGADTSHTAGAKLANETYITVISPATVASFSNIESNYTTLPVTLIPELEQYGLLQNEPNPVIESTRISFNLHKTAKVELNIYNLRGQLVKSLYSGVASSKTLNWNGKDESGTNLQAGVYLYKLLINDKISETKKLILIR